MICLHTKFHMASCHDSLVPNKNLKYKFCMAAMMMFYNLCKYLNKSCRFITVTNFRTLHYMAQYPLHLRNLQSSRLYYWWQEIKKYKGEVAISSMIFIPSSIKFCDLIQKLLKQLRHRHKHNIISFIPKTKKTEYLWTISAKHGCHFI